MLIFGCASNLQQEEQFSAKNELIRNDVAGQQKTPIDPCENKESFSEKKICYTSEAQAKKDQSICYKIEKDLAINDCLFDVATSAGSAEFCKKIPQENDRIVCFSHVGHTGKDLEGCKNLPEKDIEIIYRTGSKSYTKKKECFKGYYVNVQDDEFKKFDKSVCTYFENSAECLGRLAKLKGDYTKCDTIWCVIEIAKNNKDASLCDEAKNLFKGNYDEEIIQCKDYIAIENLNPDACETANCIGRVAIEVGDISICFNGGSKYCYEISITGSGLVGFDSKGYNVGYDRDFTVDDCNKMKEKCSDCGVSLYDACLIRAFIRDPNLKEQNCNDISDSNLKKACIYESYER